MRALALAFPLALAATGAAAQHQLEVTVVPRFGAFNHLAYRIDKDDGQFGRESLRPSNGLIDPAAWKPRARKDYLERAERGLKEGFGQLGASRADKWLAGQWDMITTARDDSGYRYRRVALRVPSAPAGATCTFVLAQESRTLPCREGQYFNLGSNKAQVASVTIRLPDGSVQAATAQVPEDFLVLALGDSFLSGQGNPDGVRSAFIDVQKCLSQDDCPQGNAPHGTLWMDERCHRSAWSLPVQVGLKLVDALAAQHGAVTVVSLACSGARVGVGINASYRGQIDMRGFVKRNRDLGWHSGLLAEKAAMEADELTPQLDALKDILSDQAGSPQAHKDTIDLLLLDGGGNDVKFSALVTDLVLIKATVGELENYKAQFKDSFTQLSGAYARARQTLEQLKVRQKVILPYPDPTRRADGLRCGGSPVDSAGLKALAKIVSGFVNLPADPTRQYDGTISDREAEFAGLHILRKLNEKVEAFATGLQARYFGETVHLLADKGWCRSNEPDGEAFGPRNRWVRKVDESLSVQGDIYGAMHPTWEYHAAASSLVTAFVTQTFTMRHDAEVQPRAEAGEWVAPKIRVGRTDGRPHWVCVGTSAECREGPAEFAHAHDTKPPALYRVVDRQTLHKRWVPSPWAARRVDAAQPQPLCSIVRGTDRLRCEDGLPISSATLLELGAVDGESGVAGVSLLAGEQQLATAAGPALATDAYRTLPDGEVKLTVAARDKVGNAAAQTYRFNKDNTAPELVGVEMAEHGPALPVILVHPNDRPFALKVVVRDAGSGPCEVRWPELQHVYSRVEPKSTCGQPQAAKDAPRQAAFLVKFQPSTDHLAGHVEDLQLETRDHAGNRLAATPLANYRIALLPARCGGSNCALSAAQWEADARAQELQAARDLAGNLGLTSPDVRTEADELRRALGAAWANLYAGRLGSAFLPAHHFADCSLKEGPGLAAAALMNMEACAGTAPEAVKSALRRLRFVP